MSRIRTEQINKIYSLLGDRMSQYIFENRLMYSLTQDMKFIRNVVETRETGKCLFDRMKSEHRPIGIFGAGDVGRHLIQVYGEAVNIVCFIDNKRAGSEYEQLPVISLREFQSQYPDGRIIISTKLYYREILEQLLQEGYADNDIINVGMEYAKLNHKQYFDLPKLNDRRVEKEVFVDGGSYDGQTILDFVKWNSGYEREIYAWEPDEKNQTKVRQCLEQHDIECELVQKGLWNEEAELSFSMTGTDSAITEEGTMKIQVDSVDHVCRQKPTFIKMDIEGAEYKALEGAAETIRRKKPKLAVCVYHKLEDIWELPWLIHELNPGYTFYLRHYSFADNETVLYAL